MKSMSLVFKGIVLQDINQETEHTDQVANEREKLCLNNFRLVPIPIGTNNGIHKL